MRAPARAPDAHEDVTYARIEVACARRIGAPHAGWHGLAIEREGAWLRCTLTPQCAPSEREGSVWVRGRGPGDGPPAAPTVLLEAAIEGWHRIALAPEPAAGNAMVVATFESQDTRPRGGGRRAQRRWLRAAHRPRSAREQARADARALAQWAQGEADPGNPFERLVRRRGWGEAARAAATCAGVHAEALETLAHRPWTVTPAQEQMLEAAGREAAGHLAREGIENDE